jgi:hypothetical protein
MTKRRRPCRAQDLVPSVSGSTLFRRCAPPSPQKASLTGLAYAWLPVARRKGRVAFRKPKFHSRKEHPPCI